MNRALGLTEHIVENIEELVEILEVGQLHEEDINEIKESFAKLYENNDTIKDFVDWLAN